MYNLQLAFLRFSQLISVAHKSCWKLLINTSLFLCYEGKSKYFPMYILYVYSNPYFKVPIRKLSFHGDMMKFFIETQVI